MAEDRLVRGIVSIIEDLADTLRADVDSIEYNLDITTASGPMLRYLASWLDANLDPNVSDERQRKLLRTVGRSVGWRGTRRGLEQLLAGLTGAPVRVSDGGGVYTRNTERRPWPDLRVTVELDDLGELSERQLYALITAELPVAAQLELRTPGRPADPTPPPAPGER
jgi:phage tail-like protein